MKYLIDKITLRCSIISANNNNNNNNKSSGLTRTPKPKTNGKNIFLLDCLKNKNKDKNMKNNEALVSIPLSCHLIKYKLNDNDNVNLLLYPNETTLKK